ncbi:unnamed protein product [Ranitomeya imitator]|uniref:VWFA domain-containing protein n=1 Tax=Ranitomeya imitator TaxID=111125 RepID=A0ABN9KTF5_9NEOB|nr:unnamed protein product [Ranitomeya imitator]
MLPANQEPVADVGMHTKEALFTILRDLRPDDHFNIIGFSNKIKVWKPNELVKVSPNNIRDAKKFIFGLSPNGGTNINGGIQTASTLLNDYLANNGKHEKSVSLIIFLTDGRPTVGEIASTRILGNTKNVIQEKFCLFSIGIGNDVDFHLLEKLSLENCGMMRRISEDEDAALQLKGVVQNTGVDMDIQGLSSLMDNLTIRVQNIQDLVVQNPMLEPKIPIPELFSGDRAKFLNFKNNCKLFLVLKPRSSGDPVQQVKIIISLLRGDPQDWAFSLAPGNPALCNIDAFFLALGLLYDEPNSVDQAEKNLLALCQGQDEIEIYCQKFRKWSVLTQWNECALAAIFRKGLSEALKDVMVGFPMPAGLNESMSLAIQISRRLRERKSVHHLAVLSEHKPEPMQCDRTLTRAERQEHRRQNGLCIYCGDSTHAISDCPKRTKRFARSATIGTLQSKFLLSITLICSLSSYSVMAFVDSGAALNLMDLEFARRCGFVLEPLQCLIPLRGIDATPLAKNKPQYWTQLTMCMAPAHQEDIRFLVLHNLHDVVVLGLPWLQVHNPVLDLKSMSVSSWGCQRVHGDVPFLSISSSTPSEVPEFLSDYRDVFDEPKSNALHPHRDCDCAIDLIPGSKFPKGRLFNLSVPEHAAMRSYVKESLEKGHIRPSSSPLGAGFFLWPRRMVR